MTASSELPSCAPVVLVVMGVSGSGKTTIARRLADTLGWDFLDGDDLHPPANIARMSAGIPLQDADRWPWLAAIAEWIERELAAGHHAVVACSALKRSYRERLQQASPAIAFVYLAVARTELARRMRQRKHFMPPELLDSQLATLEEPADDEQALRIDADGPVEEILQRVMRRLQTYGLQARCPSPPPP